MVPAAIVILCAVTVLVCINIVLAVTRSRSGRKK